MILAIDVQYSENNAVAAGVLFESWQSAAPFSTHVKVIDGIAPYEPGAFYKRELPCILALLDDIDKRLDTIVVDGYVTLGDIQAKGLGMHLYHVLQEQVAVVGVAKKAFKDTPQICEVYRGSSLKPLYVTVAGMSLADAKGAIALMHGQYRIPDLLKKADQLCRGIQT